MVEPCSRRYFCGLPSFEGLVIGLAIFFRPPTTCSREGIGIGRPFGVVCIGSGSVGFASGILETEYRYACGR